MTAEQRWLEALWPRVRAPLPPPPAVIVEIGCGRFGGFVPSLRDSGYEAVGIDPSAPEGESYRRVEFERSDLPPRIDGVIACISLHHVADPGEVLDRVARALHGTGSLIVVEWDWELFDETTARWCFERLGPSDADSWIQHRRDGWAASGQGWDEYLRGWAGDHGLHSARRLLRELDQRFARVTCERGAYYFPKLSETSEADELDAIDTGRIRAARIDYVGCPRWPHAR